VLTLQYINQGERLVDFSSPANKNISAEGSSSPGTRNNNNAVLMEYQSWIANMTIQICIHKYLKP
jgi:hypothetical protein